MKTDEEVKYNDRLDRLMFGGGIIGGNLLAMVGMAFVEIPSANATIFGQIAGGLSAALGIIVAATWKTNAIERQQAQAITKFAEKSDATGRTKGTPDGAAQPTAGESGRAGSGSGGDRGVALEVDHGVRVADGGHTSADVDAAATTYGTRPPG